MDLKKLLPILAMIAVSGVFLMGMSAVSAAHTMDVKAYSYDPYDPPGPEIVNQINITKGEYLDFAATLHVDGGNPLWFRYLNFEVYNSQGDQILNQERNTGFGGIARCWIDSKNWKAGNYTLVISYDGNEKEDYPIAFKKFEVNIL
jgi:hypothetical protein